MKGKVSSYILFFIVLLIIALFLIFAFKDFIIKYVLEILAKFTKII